MSLDRGLRPAGSRELGYGMFLSIKAYPRIYTALERRYLMEPSNERFRPEQCLDLTTSLKAYTDNPATVVGMDKDLGRVVPGMKADVFIADRDIFKVSAEDLKETVSALTIVNGSIVHNEMGI